MVLRVGGLNPLQQLRSEMDRLFSGYVTEGMFGPARPGSGNGRNFPALNVWEEGEAFVAEAEVPGLKSENIEIDVVGNELVVKGQRPDAQEEGATYHRRERGVGTFSRTLRLPAEIDSDRVEASLQDGVLTIRLPKSEGAKPRKIQVKTK